MKREGSGLLVRSVIAHFSYPNRQIFHLKHLFSHLLINPGCLPQDPLILLISQKLHKHYMIDDARKIYRPVKLILHRHIFLYYKLSTSYPPTGEKLVDNTLFPRPEKCYNEVGKSGAFW
jgi:hypothetical protein